MAHGAHELLALALRPHLLVRYEDLVSDPRARLRIADYVGLGELGSERLNLESEPAAHRDWEKAKHGGEITNSSLGRFEREPPGPVRDLADRVWRALPDYSEAFGYQVPGSSERLEGHVFAPLDPKDGNPVPFELSETWDWTGPETFEPVFARRRGRFVVARNVPEGAKVLDLACGVPALQYLLPSSCGYRCSDVRPRDDGFLVWDPAGEEVLDPGDVDLLTAVGLLECVADLPTLLRSFRATGRPVLATYHAPEDTQDLDRMSLGWRNAYSRSELMALFQAAGFTVTALWAFDGRQSLFRLRP